MTSWTRQDHDLLCLIEAPEGAEVLVLNWTREGSDRHVLLYQDGRLLHKQQNHMFRDRVELRDPQLSSGDMSLRLKNISSEDSGVYRCEAVDSEKKVYTRFIHLTVRADTTLRSSIELTARRYRGLSSGLVVGLAVFLVIVVTVFILFKSTPLFLVRLFVNPRDRTCNSVSSNTTTSTQMSEDSTKVLLHTPSDLPHLLSSSSSPFTLTRSSSESALSASDPEMTNFRAPAAHSSSPNVSFTD